MKIFRKAVSVFYYILVVPVLFHILWKLCDKYYQSFETLKRDYKSINIIPTTIFSWLVSLIVGVIMFCLALYGNTFVLELLEELMKEPSLQGIFYEMRLHSSTVSLWLLAVFFTPLYEETLKYIIIKIKVTNVNFGFAIIVFALCEFGLYISNIEVIGNVTPNVIGIIIGIIILRICAFLMHMKTISIIKNDGLITSIKFHFLWNLIIGHIFTTYVMFKIIGNGIKKLWIILSKFVRCFHR